MKRMLLAAFAIGLMPLLINSEMRYDPALDLVYSYPEAPDINVQEYVLRIFACLSIGQNMKRVNLSVSSKEVIKQCIYFLKNIATPTALRLADDLRSNKIYYPDGTYAENIF